MQRVKRLLNMIELFREHEQRLTTEELAHRYEVHVRTIQRDLALLQGEPEYKPLVCQRVWGWIE